MLKVKEGGKYILLTGLTQNKFLLAVGAISLGLAAASSLGHRYFSTDCLTHFVRRLRLHNMLQDKEKAEQASIAKSHHEKWDGTGYPDKLSGESIPIEGRITAVSDVFDALTTERPYKKPWPIEKVIELLKEESGKSFDPTLIDIFIDNLDEVMQIKETYAD